MSNLTRRGLVIPIAIGVLFVGGGWTLRNKLAADRQGEWVRVSRADVVTGVEVTGSLASSAAGSFGPPEVEEVDNFRISMMAPEGSEVTAGRPILAFDTSELQKQLEEKSAESEQALKEIEKRRADLRLSHDDEMLTLAQAEANLRKSALKLEAPPEVSKGNDLKEAELDHSLALREVAESRQRIVDLDRAAAAEIALLESKQRGAAAVVASTTDAIRKMTILAPRAGTVVYITRWNGDKMKVGDSCWRMAKVIEIPDLTKMIAKGDVDEVDAGKVAVGQRVALHLDAHPDEEFHGTIRTAGRTVQQQAGTTNPLKVLHVEIALERSDPAVMRPGMRFQGTVELARVHQTLTVPRAAVFVSPGGPVAYRRGLFSVAPVRLRLGAVSGESVEVLGGLEAGDRVLVAKAASSGDDKS